MSAVILLSFCKENTPIRFKSSQKPQKDKYLPTKLYINKVKIKKI